MAKKNTEDKVGKKRDTGKVVLFFILVMLLSLSLLPQIGFASRFIGFDQFQYDSTLSFNASNLQFYTSNQTRVYITDTGLVGIGTLTPLSTLHINGSGANGGLRVTNDSGFTAFFINSSNGRVGIGTSSPSSALDIIGKTTTTLLNVTGTSQNATFMGDVQIMGTLYGGSPVKISGGLNVSGVATGQDAIFVTNASGDKIIRITSEGQINFSSQSGNTTFDNGTFFVDNINNRVGIGTTTPTSALQVAGTITAMQFIGDGSLLSGVATSGGSSPWNSSGSRIYLNDSSSLVGIGTASPTIGKLQVDGNITSTQGDTGIGFVLYSTAGSENSLEIGQALIGSSSAPYIRAARSGNNDNSQLRFFGGAANPATATPHLMIDNTGFVGIGTTNPLSTLHINGSGANGGLRVTNDSGFTAFFVNSTNGNIGIGTTSPTAGLDVRKGESVNYITFGPTSDGSINNQQRFQSDGSGGSMRIVSPAAVFLVAGSNKVSFSQTATCESGSLECFGTNGLGIGTTNPTKRLSVNGTIDAITLDPSASTPLINTTGNNLTLSSATGSVIIKLG